MQSTGEVYEDVERIWHNCRSFNEPESDICATADEAQQAFHARWRQQGLPQPEVKADKKRGGKSGRQSAADVKAQGGKKQSGAKVKEDEAVGTKGKGVGTDTGHEKKRVEVNDASENDDSLPGTSVLKPPANGTTDKSKRRRSDNNADAAAQQPSSKRKRSHESVANNDSDDTLADHPGRKSKGKSVQPDPVPEKMSASARLRRGLPPTPPTRISPRMAPAEAVPEAAPEAAAAEADQEDDPAQHADVKAKGKAKANAKDQTTVGGSTNGQVRSSDQPASRRTSGRLK